MNIQPMDKRPLFLQIADGIEDAILLGAYPEETQIPSTTETSITYNINPATARKGFGLLMDQGIIYKQRGVGMFVAEGAVEQIRAKRRDQFFDSFVMRLTEEAKQLGLTLEETVKLIEMGYQNGKN